MINVKALVFVFHSREKCMDFIGNIPDNNFKVLIYSKVVFKVIGSNETIDMSCFLAFTSPFKREKLRGNERTRVYSTKF